MSALKLLQSVAAFGLVLSKLVGAAGCAAGSCTSKLLLCVLSSSICCTISCVLEASFASLLEAFVVVVVVVVGFVVLDPFVVQ